MKLTKNLNLPVYDDPINDTFDLTLWNEANESIDKSHEEVMESKKLVEDIFEEIPKVNASAEVIDARGGEATLGNKVRKINSLLDEIDTTKIDYINIKKYRSLVIDSDWTNAIKQALMDIAWGGTIYFPKGTYNHTGIDITTSCNFLGCSKTSSILKNVGNSDSFSIKANVERGTFKSIGVFGNGVGALCENATCKKGFVFYNNSVAWTFDDIWMRGHGDYFFYADNTGHVNNINICNSFLEWGAKGCLHFIQSDTNNQINAIYIDNCNISTFKENGVEIWGQSISIDKCTIQACGGVGIAVDGRISQTGSSGTSGINIINNYFELCNKGFISVCSNLIKTPTLISRYAGGITILGNYGVYGIWSLLPINNPTDYYCVNIQAPSFYSYDNLQMGTIFYNNNSFAKGSCGGVLNGNDVLSYNSYIGLHQTGGGNSNLTHINLGMATTNLGIEVPVTLLGKSECLNTIFDLYKSENISSSKAILFKKVNNYIKTLTFKTETDSINYNLELVTYSLGENNTHIETILDRKSNLSGNTTSTFTIQEKYISLALRDCLYFGIKVVLISPGTNFKLYNPTINIIK